MQKNCSVYRNSLSVWH